MTATIFCICVHWPWDHKGACPSFRSDFVHRWKPKRKDVFKANFNLQWLDWYDMMYGFVLHFKSKLDGKADFWTIFLDLACCAKRRHQVRRHVCAKCLNSRLSRPRSRSAQDISRRDIARCSFFHPLSRFEFSFILSFAFGFSFSSTDVPLQPVFLSCS